MEQARTTTRKTTARKKKETPKSQDTELFMLVNHNADMKRLEKAVAVKKRNERAFITVSSVCVLLGVLMLLWGGTLCVL